MDRAAVVGAREGAEWLPLVKNAIARIDEKGPSVVAAAPPAVGRRRAAGA